MSQVGPAATTDPEVVVSVRNLEKRFRRANGKWTSAVDGVSLDIRAGELVVVLGSSGCGKTTMLRCIAGLERPTGGDIRAGGKVISSAVGGVVVPPERRNFGMMFQSYAVWPHMSVFGNVAYPLRSRHTPKAQIERRVNDVLELVGIGHLRDEYPAQLSGGQQQRVALARCLVADPSVILFDEPLSNVDAKVREDLRAEILAMKNRTGFGGLYVTHDQEEAMSIADRIAVMHHGRIVQVGTPREIYGAPESMFVAHFVGTVNRWLGTLQSVAGRNGLATVTGDIGSVSVAADRVGSGAVAGDEVWVTVRPEEIVLTADKPTGGSTGNVWEVVVRAETFRGTYSEYTVALGETMLRVRVDNDMHFAEGQRAYARVEPTQVRVLAKAASDSGVV